MAHAPGIAPPRSGERRRWKRVIRRPWVRADDPGSVAALLALIPSLPRPVLAELTTRMIDRMDELAGDIDVELNGDELDASGSAEEDTPYHGFGQGDGYPGDPEDAEDDTKDCCPAGDDAVRAGLGPGAQRQLDARDIGDEDDEEEEGLPPTDALKSREAHRRRVRRTRCRAVGKMRPTYLGGGFDVHRYELLEEPTVPTLRVLRRRHRILKRRKPPR